MTDLDYIAEKAKALRAAGVRKLVIDGLTLELDPPDSPELAPDKATYSSLTDLPDADPLNDPATFGRRDGSVPGFDKTRRDDE